ncbi:MAG: isoaspartyl peptidase/L-asparaginase [Promethearchaeota archaeon]
MTRIILCHLGVGATPLDDDEKARALDDLSRRAVIEGYKVLCLDGDNAAIDAVERVVNILEESGIVNAGRGAVKQSDGVQRRDASIMCGRTLDCGAVSSLENILYPISVTRKLMEFSRLGEKPSDKFRWNFYFNGYFVEHLFNIHGEEFPARWIIDEAHDHSFTSKVGDISGGDTVGAVALDINGNLAAGTSTGGTRGSFPGRIGDSAVIGAGTYANEFCAVSNTGRGENVMKLTGAKRVCDLVELGVNAMLAVNRMHREYENTFPETPGRIGTIAIDRDGNWAVHFNGARMAWAVKTDDGGFQGQKLGEKRVMVE